MDELLVERMKLKCPDGYNSQQTTEPYLVIFFYLIK